MLTKNVLLNIKNFICSINIRFPKKFEKIYTPKTRLQKLRYRDIKKSFVITAKDSIRYY